MVSPTSLVFSVRRCEPELVVPAKATPHEIKELSDIDDQQGLRFQVKFIMFYSNEPLMKGQDPVRVIREALAKALVFYYPFAGRLIEGPNGKLIVDCTGEGVLFIEADADVTLEELGDSIQPPCANLEELLYDVPGSEGIIGCPVLLIQVTRLRCGGFIVALRLNHAISDAKGLIQFLNAVGEMAQGACAPSQPPVWQRDLFDARDPPRITCIHHEYEQLVHTKESLAIVDENNNMVQQPFFFGPKEMRAIRKHLPPHLSTSSTFEVLAACLWKCRTMAIDPAPDVVVRLGFAMNVRFKDRFQVPSGFYGNAFVYPMVHSNAKMLCENPLGYAVELVKKNKGRINEEYIRSVADFMVIKGRPPHTTAWAFLVSDNSRLGFGEVDFGWGMPIYAGPAAACSVLSFLMRFKNSTGEDGLVVPINLPLPIMQRFQQELKKMTLELVEDSYGIKPVEDSHGIEPIRIIDAIY